MVFSTSLFIIAGSIFFTFCEAVHSKGHFIYLTNYCSKTFQVHHSVVVALTPIEQLTSERNRDFISCSLDLAAEAEMGLLVHFLQLDISPDWLHSDHLNLYTMDGVKRKISPRQGIFGKLDRSQNPAGTDIIDYKINNNSLRIEYIGIPTVVNSGFKLLVTSFHEPRSKQICPAGHIFCPVSNICIPARLVCDGDHNCGLDDLADEMGCDRDDTVTDLLAKYSLAKDICVVILLPLVFFILCVVALFVSAQKYISHRIEKPLQPIVSYTRTAHCGRVHILETQTQRHLPNYDDVIPIHVSSTQCSRDEPEEYTSLELPPSYSSLEDKEEITAVNVNMSSNHYSNIPKVSSTPESLEDLGACGGQTHEPISLSDYCEEFVEEYVHLHRTEQIPLSNFVSVRL